MRPSAEGSLSLATWVLAATTNGHWVKTTLDGFGRTVSTQTGNGTSTVSEVDTTYITVFTIVFKWKLRRRVWFWTTMTILAALHVPLILFVPWTTKWVPALAIAAIDSADFCVILTILSVVGKFMEEPELGRANNGRHTDGSDAEIRGAN